MNYYNVPFILFIACSLLGLRKLLMFLKDSSDPHQVVVETSFQSFTGFMN